MTSTIKDPIRIVILDNHALVRSGICHILETHPRMRVVGEAGNLLNGLEVLSAQKPDIVLFDINIVEHTTPNLISQILKASEMTRLILVTSMNNPTTIQQAVEEGVVGVIFKTQSPDALLKAIEKVNEGEVWLERSMIANVLSRLSRNSKNKKLQTFTENIELSEREKQIVRLIGYGYKNKKISIELSISETTVRHHLTSIYNKLGVSDRLELLVYAHRHGLIKTTGPLTSSLNK